MKQSLLLNSVIGTVPKGVMHSREHATFMDLKEAMVRTMVSLAQQPGPCKHWMDHEWLMEEWTSPSARHLSQLLCWVDVPGQNHPACGHV